MVSQPKLLVTPPSQESLLTPVTSSIVVPIVSLKQASHINVTQSVYPQPQKVNLQLTDHLSQDGGDPLEVINSMKTKVNEYLVPQLIDHTRLRLHPTSINNVLNSRVALAYGMFNSVFSIEVVHDQHDLFPKNEPVILKITSNSSYNVDAFRSKWEIDRQILPGQIPVLYLYGQVFSADKWIGQYTIVKKYEDIHSFRRLDIFARKQLFAQLIETMSNLRKYELTWSDLKPANIGFETIDTQGNKRLIVLDYDPNTLMPTNEKILTEYRKGCDICAGTFPPFYLLDDFVKKRAIGLHAPISYLRQFLWFSSFFFIEMIPR